MIAAFEHWTLWQFIHPLSGNGYQFWSGIGSDFGEATIIVALIAIYRRHECHVKGCYRPQWHNHPDHGHPVCKKHHPEGKGLPVETA